MNIVCCLARVPDTTTRIAVAADGRNPDLANAQWIINPYDEYALEAAVQLREAVGGEVCAVHVGPVDFQKDLRAALAKGADKAVQLQTDSPLGPHSIAALIAAQCGKPDVVFLGKQSVDGDVGGTGAFLAHLLGVPVISRVSHLNIQDGRFTAQREIEGAVETIEGSLPAVFTLDKGVNEPRRAGLKEIMAAKKKPLDVLKVAALPARLEALKLELPQARKSGRIVGTGAAAVAELVRVLRDEAKAI
ncbi:MAG: electron transfer flavoprotein beta subunit/FixA family protein [Planctomycetes bacterium]|nr:electron transfer flavoprotein beta subunit/FixA family protein [Planctomycetota bacterium]